MLVNTAGMRQKDLEFLRIWNFVVTVMRSIRAIEHSDVVIIMVDATLGLGISGYEYLLFGSKRIEKVVIVVNRKWDLVEKETNTMRDFEE